VISGVGSRSSTQGLAGVHVPLAYDQPMGLKWSIRRRFRKLSPWNKLGALGSLASIVALGLWFLPGPPSKPLDVSQFQQDSQDLRRYLTSEVAALRAAINSVPARFPSPVTNDSVSQRLDSVERSLPGAEESRQLTQTKDALGDARSQLTELRREVTALRELMANGGYSPLSAHGLALIAPLVEPVQTNAELRGQPESNEGNTPRLLSLEEIVAKAQLIVSGRVVAVGLMAGERRVTLELAEVIKGSSTKRLTVRQRSPTPESLELGQRVVWYLNGPTSGGFYESVGDGAGFFAIARGDGGLPTAENLNSNRGLWKKDNALRDVQSRTVLVAWLVRAGMRAKDIDQIVALREQPWKPVPVPLALLIAATMQQLSGAT